MTLRPISLIALASGKGPLLIPPVRDKGLPDDLVFKGLRYSSWNNHKLAQWMLRAGITKTITFHCARHTYAVLQLDGVGAMS